MIPGLLWSIPAGFQMEARVLMCVSVIWESKPSQEGFPGGLRDCVNARTVSHQLSQSHQLRVEPKGSLPSQIILCATQDNDNLESLIKGYCRDANHGGGLAALDCANYKTPECALTRKPLLGVGQQGRYADA